MRLFKLSVSRLCPKPREPMLSPRLAPATLKQRRVVRRCSSRDNETADQAMQRRLRESMEVEQRVHELESHSEFSSQVLQSDDALVVVEVTSDVVCDTGIEEEVELHWKEDQKQQKKEMDEVCSQIKHVFQRTARECKDVKFFAIDCDTENGAALCDELEIDTIPTLRFYRKGQLLWEHKGALHLQQDLGEGVLYYANQYAGGADAEAFVHQIKTPEDFQNFISAEEDGNTLKVIDVSVERAEPCIKIYPAVLALAKNLKGYVSFARLMVDDPNLEPLAKELRIRDVPTFLFYKKGKEVERNASSSRGDLIGQILAVQGMMGLPPPPPKPSPNTQRSRKIKQP